jgi:uncharacterized protein YjaG (DUF416 family)
MGIEITVPVKRLTFFAFQHHRSLPNHELFAETHCKNPRVITRLDAKYSKVLHLKFATKINFFSKREEAFDLDPPPDDVFSSHQ